MGTFIQSWTVFFVHKLLDLKHYTSTRKNDDKIKPVGIELTEITLLYKQKVVNHKGIRKWHAGGSNT